MNYYVTIIKGISDGTESREILKFTDIISAKAKAYSSIGSAMSDTNCLYGFAVINNVQGQQLTTPVSFMRPTEVTE